MNIKKRVEAVQAKLKESGSSSGYYITSRYNRQYLTGITTSSGCIIITPTKSFFLTDSRYIEYAKEQLSACYTVLLFEGSRKEQFTALLKDEDLKSVLYEENHILLRDKKLLDDIFSQYELKESGNIVETLRNVKDEEEIANIIEAQRITDLAFLHIVEFISDNRGKLTENDVAFEMEFFMRRNGAESLAFDTICVSGEKSSRPHGEPDNVLLSNGFLTLDYGAKVNGYCTDMTRTICLGKPDSEMKKIYETVKSAQLAALEVASGNALGGAADKAARDIIKDAGYENFFTHGLGHAVGMEIHEPLGFSQNNQTPLPVNSVMTVEPGIYIEGKYGVRIEDIIVLKENGCLNLTKSKKDLIIL